MTSNFQRVGLIAVFEGAAKFVQEVKKAADEEQKLAAASAKTAQQVSKSADQTVSSSKKTSATLAEQGAKVSAVYAKFTKDIDTASRKAEESNTRVITTAKQAADAQQKALTLNVQPRDVATGRFLPKAPVEERTEATTQAVQAQQEATRAIVQRREATEALSKAQRNLATLKDLSPENIAELADVMGIVANQTQTAGGAAQQASQRFKNLGQAFLNVAKAAATAFVAYKAFGILKGIISDTAELGVQTFTLQKQIGGTAEDVSGLLFAFKQFGIEPSKVSTALGIFSRNLALVEQNAAGLNTRGQQSTRVLAALGIQVLDSNNKLLPTLTILGNIADKFQEMGDEALKQGIAVQIFGEEAGRVLIPFLDQGSKGIEALIARAKELGLTFTDEGALGAFRFAQAQKELNQAFLGLRVAIGNELLPILTELANSFTEFVSKNRGAIAAFAKDVIGAVKNFGTGVGTIIKALDSVNEALSFIPKNEAVIVAAIVAIGAAMTAAWGPAALPIVGLTLLVTQLGRLKNLKDIGALGASREEALRTRQATLQSELSRGALRGGNTDIILNSIDPVKIGDEIGKGIVKGLHDIISGPGLTDKQRARREEELAEITAELAELDKKRADEENKLKTGLDGVTDAMRRQIAETQKLAQGFADSSRAVGQVEALTARLGLFGTITKELADAVGLTAIQAGNVQGFDAARAAMSRGQQEAFNYAATLGTVAQAFRENASVARQIVLELARSALEASQRAAQAVFARPTREVANLNVNLARQRLNTAQLTRGSFGQLGSLQRQLERINKQIDAANQAARTSDKARKQREQEVERQRQRQEDKRRKEQKEAAEAADRAARAQLDALRIANLQAQHAYERFNARLEALIDATREAASELQQAFFKANEDLQRQINEAIGRGDITTALTLVDEQSEQTKAYRDQSKALRDNEQRLLKEQKQARLVEEERRRQAELAEALAQASFNQRRSSEELTESTEESTDKTDENTESTEANTEALDKQKEKIEAEIEALQGPIDASKEQEQAIQNIIDVYQAETEVLKALVEAADNTLLSQNEQAAIIGVLIEQISIESNIIRGLVRTYSDLIPEVFEATQQFNLMNDAIRVISDPKWANTFISNIDLAAEHARLLALAEESVEQAIRRKAIEDVSSANRVAAAADAAANKIVSSANRTEFGFKALLFNVSGSFKAFFFDIGKLLNQVKESSQVKPPSGTPKAAAEGGIYSTPTRILIGETHQKEMVLPLERPQRARELLAQVPPSTLAALLPRGSQAAVFAPNISVSGQTLETMETVAIRAVHQAFRDARVSSTRSGGLISQGIGPSR